jgi:AraC-like DNA-binding protein
MNKIVLTKAHQFWPLTEYMSGFGVPIGRHIERFHLPQKMLDAPELFIDEARFWRLAGDLAKREGFPDWGFRAAQQLDLLVFGEFGETLLRQPTLKTGLETFVTTITAESINSHFSLMREGTRFWFTLRGYRNPPAGRDVIELYELRVMVKLVQDALGNQWLPPAAHLQCASLPEGLAVSEICTGNIRFCSTMTAIAIPEALMAAPMSRYRSFPVADNKVERSTQDQSDFATSLRLLLSGYLDESLTIGNAADLVGMSERTLQRRLAEQGTSFNDLLDQVRFDAAKQLLQHNSISVTDISGELGYKDPANFTRAFRRWAGVSPRRHRQLFSQSN